MSTANVVPAGRSCATPCSTAERNTPPCSLHWTQPCRCCQLPIIGAHGVGATHSMLLQRSCAEQHPSWSPTGVRVVKPARPRGVQAQLPRRYAVEAGLWLLQGRLVCNLGVQIISQKQGYTPQPIHCSHCHMIWFRERSQAILL